MKVRLLKPANIQHNAGEVVTVSPERASFLMSVGIAVPVAEIKEAPVFETPEDKKPVRRTAKK